MDEDPQNHDFDQRRDGPDQEDHRPGDHSEVLKGEHSKDSKPSVQYAPDTKRPLPTGHNSDSAAITKSRSNADDGASSPPIIPPSRHSTSMLREKDDFAKQKSRRSSGISHKAGRPSEDFDTRRDGPYGRPSITMTRRKSSGFATANEMPTSPIQPQQEEPAVLSEDSKQPVEENQPPSEPPSTTFASSDPAFEPEPPPLNYSLWARKWSILFWWSMILFDSIVMPIALYFGLWYGLHVHGKMSANTVFSIVTAALGGASILDYFLRFWRLWKKGSTCRVIGARRMYLDWFHWNFTGAWIIIMLELIIGSVQENPYIRLLSMPLATMLYCFGTQLMIIDIARYFQYPAPCRISSIPKGAQLRPGIYSVIEDICAVDGSGGTTFREELNRRYEASHVFRAMLRRLGIFWAVGAQACAVVTTVLVFTLVVDAAYTIGWSLPFVWAGLWTWLTIVYVRRCLIREKTAWAEEVAAKSQA